MVYRHIEEALNLVGMQVHGDDTVHTGHTEQVGHQLGTDAHTRLVLAVLAGPSEIRNHGDDAVGGGTFGCVNHQKELHQVVGVGKCALHKKHIAPSDRILVGNGKLTVGEVGNLEVAQRTAKVLADFLCQVS